MLMSAFGPKRTCAGAVQMSALGVERTWPCAADANDFFWGLAPDPTPLPATLPLFATGLGALGLLE